jgi:hypothetical protein
MTARNPFLTKAFLEKEYVQEKKSARRIAQDLGVAYCTVYRALSRFNIAIRGSVGENHGRWTGGRTIRNGYWIVYMPDHRRVMRGGRVYEHIIVAEKKYGRPIKRTEHIHHIDGNRLNNSLENLLVCSIKEHGLIHASYEQLLTLLLQKGVIKFENSRYTLVETGDG